MRGNRVNLNDTIPMLVSGVNGADLFQLEKRFRNELYDMFFNYKWHCENRAYNSIFFPNANMWNRGWSK